MQIKPAACMWLIRFSWYWDNHVRSPPPNSCSVTLISVQESDHWKFSILKLRIIMHLVISAGPWFQFIILKCLCVCVCSSLSFFRSHCQILIFFFFSWGVCGPICVSMFPSLCVFLSLSLSVYSALTSRRVDPLTVIPLPNLRGVSEGAQSALH